MLTKVVGLPLPSIVYDGVDEGRVSRNSGAESNIEGGLALLACVREFAPS